MDATVAIQPENLEINSMTPLEAAMAYTRRGWSVVPVPYRDKNPGIDGWQKLRLAEHDLPHHFNGHPQNLGILVGVPSGGLTDVDLDCQQAIQLAPLFLPSTACIFGRPGKPCSHWIYQCKPMVAKTIKFKDVRDEIINGKKKRPTLVEVRSTGGQTVFPPSTHESGEAIAFVQNGEPAVVEGPVLVRRVAKLAAATLLARHWPGEGSRHDVAAALAGGLSRAGWAKDEVVKFVGAVARAGGDDDVDDRQRVASDTVDNTLAGRKTTGWPTLIASLGKDVVNAVCKWLQIRWSDEPSSSPASDSELTEEQQAPLPSPKTVRELTQLFTTLRKPVIYGLLRRGETMNIIASPKTGKSWLAMDLAIAIAAGRPWLNRFQTESGEVLIYDNELHAETTSDRFPAVATARGMLLDDYGDRIRVHNIRGQLREIRRLGLPHLPPNKYTAIILDAFYRFLPPGTDENDNAAMAAIYNYLDSCADRLGCCFVLIHHTSKGNQSGKAVTDVGAGAGSQSRATDAHLVLRPHQQRGVVVLDAMVRSWAPLDPFCLRWDFPIWVPDDTFDPTQLRQEGRRERKADAEMPKATPEPKWNTTTFAEAFLTKEPQSAPAIIQAAIEKGLSDREATRLLKVAVEQKKGYRWTNGSKRSDGFATVEQTLLDIPSAPKRGRKK